MFNYSINDTENALTIQFPLSRDKHKIDKKAASHTGGYSPQWSAKYSGTRSMGCQEIGNNSGRTVDGCKIFPIADWASQ